jgi:uncharacterized membrane protein (UPF0136 family)
VSAARRLLAVADALPVTVLAVIAGAGSFTVVLAGGVLLSLAANLSQAQPTAWGRIVAAVPAAFLVAVSMIERRAARHPPPSSRRQGRRHRRAVRAGTAIPGPGR